MDLQNHCLMWGRHVLELDIPAERLITLRRSAPAAPVADLAAVMRDALENPFHFPPLRQALTPDDHVAIAVDETLPHLPKLLVPLLEHIRSAGVTPDAITLVCLPPSTGQEWALELPDEFQDVQVEVHQPGERRKLSYLATTRQGRRIYLNRSAVDADQLILLTGRGYDPRYGVSGAATALFPSLADDATQREFASKLSLDAPVNGPWPVQAEATEVAWLLGAPFLVQVIEGGGGEVLHILGGTVESNSEGQRLLDERWRVEAGQAADTVIASISKEAATFEDLAHAFYAAARVVRSGGRIILLTDAEPSLGRAAGIMEQQSDPVRALKIMLEEKPVDLAAGFLWASAAAKARLFLFTRLPAPSVEKLFATPLPNVEAVHALINSDESYLILPDAHKTLAIIGHG